MKPFQEYVVWPRRVVFLSLVVYAFLVYNRLFSAIVLAVILTSLDVIFTRVDNNRKIINEFFKNYQLYERKEAKDE